MHRWGKWGPVPPGAWLQFLPAPTAAAAAAEAGGRLSPKTHILKPTILCQEVKKNSIQLISRSVLGSESTFLYNCQWHRN